MGSSRTRQELVAGVCGRVKDLLYRRKAVNFLTS
jgi:hypothetical protein